jgi:hypothetical protein
MKLARRPRSDARRACTALFGTFLAVILLSMVWSPSYEGRALYIRLDRGSIFFSTELNPRPEGWSVSLSRSAPRFLFNMFPTVGGSPAPIFWRGFFPLWTPLGLLALATFALWWRERRPFPAGRCRTCGYDLTGNVSGRCPECGGALGD